MTDASEHEWKQLRLSLERPYKDDLGNPIPVLFDITPEGERIYESKEPASSRLNSRLQRIFDEQGPGIFERRNDPEWKNEFPEIPEENEVEDEKDSAPKPMTVEELHVMRMEITPQLFVALGEMSQARDLLTSLLSSSQSGPIQFQEDPAPPLLSATTVTKPAPILSVQAFNAQLATGGKDEALRTASNLFKAAAESMGRGWERGEKYWVDALRARRANWGLSPAPLPPGSATGKGADKTSKDFMISYGLEGSPAAFRRRAIAHLPTIGDTPHQLLFPFHQNARLRTSITHRTGPKSETSAFTPPMIPDSMELSSYLKNAQVEIVDQEIFAFLGSDAGNLPSASAQVSERLIIINVAQGLDLTFELIDSTDIAEPHLVNGGTKENICELLYHVLHVLLLRKHHAPTEKTTTASTTTTSSSKAPQKGPLLLQPIIDALRYQVFCENIHSELRRVIASLKAAGVPAKLTFTGVGDSGERLVSLLSEREERNVVGEAVLRIDNRHTLQFSMVSPSTLTAHLPQATLSIFSIPQLSQLLMDEINKRLLQKICNMGREICHAFGGVWFIDLDRCVARWEGVVLTFQISFDKDFHIGCTAFRVDSSTGREGVLSHYISREQPLFDWVKEFIQSVS